MARQEQMDVLIVEGSLIRKDTIENTLDAAQAIVGGYIEVVPFPDGFLIVCNEEGMIHELPRNVLGLYGTCFICHIDENNPQEFRGLTPDEERVMTTFINRVALR